MSNEKKSQEWRSTLPEEYSSVGKVKPLRLGKLSFLKGINRLTAETVSSRKKKFVKKSPKKKWLTESGKRSLKKKKALHNPFPE